MRTHSHFLRLLASTAFANGGYHMSAPLKTVGAEQLAEAVAGLDARDSDDLLAYAPDLNAMVPYWDKTDAIVEGYDAIVAGAETFLPKFGDENQKDYDVRLSLTKFTNVYRDIVEALASKPFEEEITLSKSEKSSDAPQEIIDFMEDVDGAGNNATVFSSLTMFNGINSAIDWIFIDYPKVDREAIKTRADEKAAGIRPFWTHVLGRNVREVKTRIVNGRQVISYIRIFEPGVTGKDHVREFWIDDASKVQWTLWVEAEKSNDKTKFTVEDNGTLSIDEIPLVPFATGRRDGTSWKFYPAMRDAADLQIKLYQAESGLEFITTMSAYPMLAANGMRPQYGPDGKTPLKIAIGPMKVLYGLPDNNGNHGSWAFVEPSAAIMTFLQDKCEKTKQDLRELGRQPLTATSGQLTVITTAVAAGKARSAVSAWALLLKDALENALVITCKYMSIKGYEPEVSVYNEFDNFTDGSTDVDALLSMREKREISQETLHYEMKRRKVLSPEFNTETERERLLAEVPSETVDLEDDDDTGDISTQNPLAESGTSG